MSEPAKVYIFTAGGRADYAIRAVFSTRELAEAFAAKYGDSFVVDGDKADIEEWTLDDSRATGDHLLRYRVALARNGDVESVVLTAPVSIGGPDPQSESIFIGLMPDGGVYGWVMARDEQHAVKIANEKRVQLIAEGEAGISRVGLAFALFFPPIAVTLESMLR